MRKILLVCSMLVVFLGLGFNTKANTLEEPTYVTVVKQEVEVANNKIELLVHAAQVKAEELVSRNLTQEEYNAELDEIIFEVIQETNEVAAEMKAEAAEYGVVVECVYVDYVIGNRTVAIDPLIVIAWGFENQV